MWAACIVPALLSLSGCDASSALIRGPVGEIAIAGDAERGLRLLGQYRCGSCHAIPGVPASRGVTGPALVAFGKRSYIAGRVPNTAGALARWIVAPTALVPDTTMPSMGVSTSDARDMAAYLGTLR
jgi:cytochrome c